MRPILVTWVGHTDLRAPAERHVAGVGPIAQVALANRTMGLNAASILRQMPPNVHPIMQ